jgi:hypothetical protein
VLRGVLPREQVRSYRGAGHPLERGLPAIRTPLISGLSRPALSRASSAPAEITEAVGIDSKAIVQTLRTARQAQTKSRSAFRPPRAHLILILGAPLNHAGRKPIFIRRANRQGCRFSRAGPGMALRGGPPNQCRITGMPSDSEGPSGGARAFCLLLGPQK